MQMLSRDDQIGQYTSNYTSEQEDFIRETYPDNGPTETARLFNEKFQTDLTKVQIYNKAKYMGVRWKGRNRWRKEIVEYLKEHYSEDFVEETVKAINEKFGTHFTAYALITKASDLGLRRNYIPQNFKKGVPNPYLDSAPIGTITVWRKTKDRQYPMIKVKNIVGGKRRKENWIPYKDYVWEQHNGKIPENCFIAVADGNEENCSIDNLRCIPMKYVQNLCNHNHWYKKGKEILDAGIAWCDLHYALIDKEKDDD